jgi:hypothetical protein
VLSDNRDSALGKKASKRTQSPATSSSSISDNLLHLVSETTRAPSDSRNTALETPNARSVLADNHISTLGNAESSGLFSKSPSTVYLLPTSSVASRSAFARISAPLESPSRPVMEICITSQSPSLTKALSAHVNCLSKSDERPQKFRLEKWFLHWCCCCCVAHCACLHCHRWHHHHELGK